MKLATRSVNAGVRDHLVAQGVPELLARLYAARGVVSTGELNRSLADLLPPAGLLGIDAACALLAKAIAEQRRILIVADYDCDGATGCAVGVRGLRLLGARVDYLVPNRFEFGYGLTPEIVALAQQRFAPHLIITVDNGIASAEGVEHARALGIDVLITDHHLPGTTTPNANVIVNPNQHGCTFASKHLAGVGVMFYILLALRAQMRLEGVFTSATQPRLDRLLDLVALGTVADVVRLDANNRLLVAQGLERMRGGRMQPGVAALFTVAGREARSASASDLGFGIGPRINAAGRLADMSLGIECLITDDPERAMAIALELNAMNQARRSIEATMQNEALEALAALEHGGPVPGQATLSVFDPRWHQGVVGILASRLKDRYHRPAFALAPVGDGTVRGSGRSIAGVHLRDVLDLVSKFEPDLLLKFGGHAMAAGLTLRAGDEALFAAAFEAAARDSIDPVVFAQTLETDGPLREQELTLSSVRLLEREVWGQGFSAPLFCDEFTIKSQRIVKEKHLKLTVLTAGRVALDAIWFNRVDALPDTARLVYRISEDTYGSAPRLQLMIEYGEAV